jgi:hypothetical protein
MMPKKSPLLIVLSSMGTTGVLRFCIAMPAYACMK